MAEKTNQYWITQIETYVSNNPDWTAERIEIELDKDWKKLPEQVRLDVKAVPSLRVIQRERARFQKLVKESSGVVDRYRYFRWPESMETGLVPWEASESCFELIRALWPELRDHVPAMLLRRYWQVTQSAPTMPRLDRLRLAVRWSLFDRLGLPEGIRWCESVLIHKLWVPGSSITEAVRQIRQIERAIEPRKDIEIDEAVLNTLVQIDESEYILWTLPVRLFVLAHAMGLHSVELSLWGHELEVQEKNIQERRTAHGELGGLQGLGPETGSPYKGGGILDPANWKTAPGDEK